MLLPGKSTVQSKTRANKPVFVPDTFLAEFDSNMSFPLTSQFHLGDVVQYKKCVTTFLSSRSLQD